MSKEESLTLPLLSKDQRTELADPVRKVKKTKTKMDGFSPTHLKPPHPPPLMWTTFFYLTIVLSFFFQFLYIIFTLKVKKNVKSGLGPKRPHPPPPNVDYVFLSHHCFIILFQFLYIIFTLKVKKNVKSGLGPKPPPPHCGLNPSNFFFFLTLKKHFDGFIPHGSDVDYVLFTLPILTYIMREGKT